MTIIQEKSRSFQHLIFEGKADQGLHPLWDPSSQGTKRPLPSKEERLNGVTLAPWKEGRCIA